MSNTTNDPAPAAETQPAKDEPMAFCFNDLQGNPTIRCTEWAFLNTDTKEMIDTIDSEYRIEQMRQAQAEGELMEKASKMMGFFKKGDDGMPLLDENNEPLPDPEAVKNMRWSELPTDLAEAGQRLHREQRKLSNTRTIRFMQAILNLDSYTNPEHVALLSRPHTDPFWRKHQDITALESRVATFRQARCR